MDNFKRNMLEHYRRLNDLPDNKNELPRFLSSCNSIYKIIDPQNKEEVQSIINFFKLKLNSQIFLAFQNREFSTFLDFETALKNHYFRKKPSYSFYIQLLSNKQKFNESVHCFVNRLIAKKNEFLIQSNTHDLNIDEIMKQAVINGVTEKLKIFAQLKANESFDDIIKCLEEQECRISTQNSINEVNVANIYLEKQFKGQNSNDYIERNPFNSNQGYNNQNNSPDYNFNQNFNY